MIVFLDFEASSLSDDSYPIEVGWVFETGEGEGHLIRPKPDWTDWNPGAEAIHGLPREALLAQGEPVEAVAARMIATLAGHALYATAPSWDGKWLSVLLRGAGLPRHALRLQDADAVHLEAAREMLAQAGVAAAELEARARQRLAAARARQALTPVRHRALEDARSELAVWRELRMSPGD